MQVPTKCATSSECHVKSNAGKMTLERVTLINHTSAKATMLTMTKRRLSSPILRPERPNIIVRKSTKATTIPIKYAMTIEFS